MKIAGIEFPDRLLSALRDDNVVVFAGAGVSMGSPANLPSFKRLTELIAQGTGEAKRDVEPEDRFLGRLSLKGVGVHVRAAEILSQPGASATCLHRDLLRLFSDARQVRLVTTNFDLLFESAAREVSETALTDFVAPALPLGDDFRGIVHVHGALTRPEQMVLTDADFGRAYLTEGWARRFLVSLFRRFTVLFIGYGHNDVIVSYLARALPGTEAGKRFVLTSAVDDRPDWEALGIEPVVYPKLGSGNYSFLYQGVRKLAETVTRSFLDWRREVTELARSFPPVVDEERDVISEALKRLETTRFFVATARAPEWIPWLDEYGHLDCLFGGHELQDHELSLALWLAEHYAVSHSSEVFLVVAKHGTRLSLQFWWALARAIFASEETSIDEKVLARWVSLLIATAPANPDQTALFWMGRYCARRGALTSLVRVFDFMATSRLELRRGFSRGLSDEQGNEPIEAAVSSLVDEYTLNSLWIGSLKPNLRDLSASLLSVAVRRLGERHSIWGAWWRADRKFDLESYLRTAIEPHAQDSYRKDVDVLIDAARDCLECLAADETTKAFTASWCDQFRVSEVPLLRRLSLHALSLRQDLTSDEKLDWLIVFGLHDASARHELFRAAQLCYPGAGLEARARTVEAVLGYRWPREEDPDGDRFAARQHYDWLRWLSAAASDCTIARRALDEVLTAHPEFRPSDHPDLTHWSTSGFVIPQKPWSAEELLQKSPAEWVDVMLSFRSSGPFGDDRQGPTAVVAEAAERDVSWGLGLADALAAAERWDAYVWAGLLEAWRKAALDEPQTLNVLALLDRAELRSVRSGEIADLLCEWVKGDSRFVSPGAQSMGNSLARQLWRELDSSRLQAESDDWLFRALNSTAGKLAQFWIYSLSRWRKAQDPAPNSLSGEYMAALSEIVSDETDGGMIGRCFLCSQLPFLLVADENWARQNLVHLFYPESSTFMAAWDGFLAWANLNPLVAKLLEPAFLKAVRHIGASRDRRERFTEYYMSMAIYFVADPLATWIPEIVRYGSAEMRNHLVWSIGQALRGMDQKRVLDLWNGWLRRYWEDRLQGVPKPLENAEIEAMLDWLPHMRGVFSQAVDLAVQMRAVELQHGTVLYDLARMEFPPSENEPLARLLLFLGTIRSAHLIWIDGRTLIDTLLGTDLSALLKEKLTELKARARRVGGWWAV